MSKVRSQERLFWLVLAGNYCLLMGLIMWLTWQNSHNVLYMVTVWMLLSPLYVGVGVYLKGRFFAPYRAMQTMMDAIRFSDASIKTVPEYTEGIAAQLHNELLHINTLFSVWHTEQNRHALLVNELLQALDNPILVVNEDFKLTMGNSALSSFLKCDWRLKKFEHLTALGFTDHQGKWGFRDETIAASHQLRRSEISLNGARHQLLLISNIQAELKESQSEAWRQLVKVLSHEIKNSLTPIKSIAQTLVQFSNDNEQQKMLAVIVDRSQHLQQFVANYASLEKSIMLKCTRVDITALFARVRRLYPDQNIAVKIGVEQWQFDPILIEQVLINLLKNALESCSAGGITAHITLSAHKQGGSLLMKVVDNGIGIAQVDNLFVPFYTTKADGQGIGLVWCKKVVEQHQGALTLTALPDGGAAACIKLV
ncbi:hypothetical protein CWB96_04890 [Pseudoalteromonas citrea]|uniref:histidine kinase n=1 Tax=Pseudoalteromonas citrea TaxID=43655 RepID=A0A5S3XSG6_9GAMM|nr:HAMP domain-containing sensor histidine kinase [Pseudoalteromonas citrea]TMP44714.1 hypothetical protein CWB97_05755 [Pseudoalteromonas citrea]TMP61088.1 hypothetical protein CWB96_04890 [Pseudoalteromonas citrea]